MPYAERNAIQSVLWNLEAEEGPIASYQWKSPFELLVKEPSGALKNEWWAIVDAFRTASSAESHCLTP